ncbi:MAG TPA: RNA polymerase sigma factor [Candidatus Saccharimonadales bacterium]|nr:RNA polymerase sigma factor [Candidatus Saccharimonadales bacterium]
MYDTYADDIFRYVFVHVRDRELAEDLTADTFMRAWKSIESFDFSQPRPWLYKIARNLITDHWRKHKTELLPEDFEQESDEDITENVERHFTKTRVRGAVHTLNEPMRSVVIMRFITGYSVRDTATSLRLTESNVRVLQHRALKQLKEHLS